MEERLQKILSRAGVASRRAAERIMAEGRVTLNGVPAKTPGTKADLDTDVVKVDGVRVKPAGSPVYILLNKPRGVVTTRHDPERRETVMDLVPKVAGLFPVGRLDVTTEGLILLTNDGDFALHVSHPRYEIPRIYRAKVRGLPTSDTLERLRKGVRVERDMLAFDRVRIIEEGKNSWIEVTLHEGKNHEVKRLLEAVGHPVSKLRRVGIGPLSDRGLEAGHFRGLTPAEVAHFKRGTPHRRGEGEASRERGPEPKDARRTPPVKPERFKGAAPNRRVGVGAAVGRGRPPGASSGLPPSKGGHFKRGTPRRRTPGR